MDSTSIVNTSEILEAHSRWVREEDGGSPASFWKANLRGSKLRGAELWRADLYEANLKGVDLWGANLKEAVLRSADLRCAVLHRANLREANLREANLRGADLGRADLREATLRGADLRGANLWGADLRDVDLRGADLREADLRGVNLLGADMLNTRISPYLIVPTEGAFIGWKSIGNYILKIEIEAEAKRANGIGSRQCRTDRAKIAAVYDREGNLVDNPQFPVGERPSFTVEVGAMLKQDSFIDDVRDSVASGLQFFLTREEAVESGETVLLH